MLLRALRDVPSTCTAIRKGDLFRAADEYAEQRLIQGGDAEEVKLDVNGATPREIPDWTGQTVVVLASGESLTEEQCAQVKASGCKTIAINTTFRRAPWADIIYGCDARWWKVYGDEVFRDVCLGQCWSLDPPAKIYGCHLVKSEKLPGLSKKPDTINQGENSGYQAIGLAYLTGAKKIILLGFDMKGGHWHGEHPPGLRVHNPYRKWIENFKPLAADLAAAGVEVINATPGSAMKSFRYVPLEQCLRS